MLDYASPIWYPNSVELINWLEGVQCTKRIPSIGHLSYNDRLTYLGLQRLEARRLCSDLLLLSKLKFDLTHLTLADFSINTSRLDLHLIFTHLSLTLISLFHALSVCGMHIITMLLMLFITYSFVACYY